MGGQGVENERARVYTHEGVRSWQQTRGIWLDSQRGQELPPLDFTPPPVVPRPDLQLLPGPCGIALGTACDQGPRRGPAAILRRHSPLGSRRGQWTTFARGWVVPGWGVLSEVLGRGQV